MDHPDTIQVIHLIIRSVSNFLLLLQSRIFH